MVKSQGGDSSVVYDINKVPLSEHRITYRAPFDGVVQEIEAHEIGLASVKLGAGRTYADDEVDHHAGLLLHKKVGARVKKGEPLITAFASEVPSLEDVETRLNEGYERGVDAINLVPDEPHVII